MDYGRAKRREKGVQHISGGKGRRGRNGDQRRRLKDEKEREED